MREIKFRAWNKEGEMSYPDDQSIFIALDGTLAGWTAGGLFDLANFELMQFTGLKDKNGEEIYEGDIIGGLIPSIVRWDNDRAGFSPFIDFICIATQMEVIGNIYENKELLKEKKDG